MFVDIQKINIDILEHTNSCCSWIIMTIGTLLSIYFSFSEKKLWPLRYRKQEMILDFFFFRSWNEIT